MVSDRQTQAPMPLTGKFTIIPDLGSKQRCDCFLCKQPLEMRSVITDKALS